jgi:tubulin epsilon
VLAALHDAFPALDRLVMSVFPNTTDDDVVTSPYNAGLAMQRLVRDADVVFAVDNARLASLAPSPSSAGAGAAGGGGRREGAFDGMNTAAAHVLTSLTASARFEGSLNVDVNEIATNLVPFPRQHFLAPAIAPLSLVAPASRHATRASRGVMQSFADCFDPYVKSRARGRKFPVVERMIWDVDGCGWICGYVVQCKPTLLHSPSRPHGVGVRSSRERSPRGGV